MKRYVSLVAFVFPFLVNGSVNAEFETPILVVGGKLVRTAGQPAESGWVLIDKGRIIGVGLGATAPAETIPADAETLDVAGAVIYPGFIDANSHAGMTKSEPTEEEQSRVEDENPDVKQGPQSATVQAHRRLMHPRWRVAELYNPVSGGTPGPGGGRGTPGSGGPGGRDAPAASSDEKDVRAEQRAAGFTAALVSPKPAIFSGFSAVVSLGAAPVRRSILTADFAQHSAFITGTERGDFAAVFERPRYPTTTMGAMAAFRQIMMDAQWQRKQMEWRAGEPAARRIPLDPDLDALNELHEGREGFVQVAAKPVVFLANSENEIHRALNMAAELRLTPIIAGAREGWKVATRLKNENVPVIVSLKWSEDPDETLKSRKVEKSKPEGGVTSRPSEKETPTGKKKLFDDEWESQAWETAKVFDEKKRLWGEEVDNLKRLHEAGLNVSIGSFEQKSVGDILKNIQKAIERGLPEAAAVAMLTTNASAILKQESNLGEIAVGKAANLTLLSKPLSDKEAKVRSVFVDGKRFEIDEKGPDGGGMGKGRRGRRGGPEDDSEDSKRPERVADSQPSTAPGSQPAEPVKRPTFAAEIESDRTAMPKTGGNILIKNATLLTVSGDDLVGTDLLIRDGKIAELGKNLAVPPDVLVADLNGYFVSPGIIDPHSHMCSDGGLNEFALSVTCEVRVKDVIDHTDVSAYRALAGGVTCVHTMHGSANTIGGQNAVLRLKYGRPAAEWIVKEAPQTVKFALGENVKQSNSDRRSRGTRFPNTRAGVEAVIRRSFDAALAYRAAMTQFDKDKADGKQPRPLRRDLRLEALASILEGSIWVHSHCYRADEIVRLLTVAEEYGFRVAVLQHVLEGYRLIPEMLRHGAAASTFSDWWAYKIEAWEAIPHNAARMAQGGVVATINSDSAEVGRHLNLEAAKSMRFGGLSPNDALRLCTLNGAIQLGIDKVVGSIEVGKFADLAIFNGHPLDTTARCVMTLIDGEVYFKHAGLDLTQPSAPRPTKPFVSATPLKPLVPLSGDDYWLVGGTVHPVSGAPITNGVVHIAGGKLDYVGPRPDAAKLRGAAIMDTSGLHVYPGLVNAGTSLGLEEIQSVQ
ncbi:MAG: amidohydrolase family protein, partial [Planctomycetota bacterium]